MAVLRDIDHAGRDYVAESIAREEAAPRQRCQLKSTHGLAEEKTFAEQGPELTRRVFAAWRTYQHTYHDRQQLKAQIAPIQTELRRLLEDVNSRGLGRDSPYTLPLDALACRTVGEKRPRLVRVEGRLSINRDARTAHVDNQPLQLTRL